ncbi:MAG: 16S rRNA (cytosine(1402)-N(4))-methyltransferase RsmH [Clostridia bacterium]|nr:16S rRNA (cytosine(1402)-N(4))-methyltransferase RsmH [Clostridia bacterium]MBR5423918.1 16S rRNA (cytosine(1402)-N(4))-methyltransferase RsmH [Clostridia bacterium]
MAFSHIPVLFNETIDSLRVKPDGVYVDCTAGGGGHAAAVLERLSPEGRLIAIDRDPDAIANLKEKFRGEPRLTLVHGNFADVEDIVREAGVCGADGVLADLGVSSYQLDTPERGFSFHSDAPLDMRMSKEGRSARDVVNGCTEAELRRILYAYGEEKFAPSIAKRIVEERAKKPIETTFELAEIVKSGIPARARREGGHPARRSFQAIRIEVNGELQHLEQSVEAMFSVLNVGGVLSVITFHSLEDRAVKLTFRKLCEGCTCPPSFPVCVCGKTPRGKLAGKPVVPSEEELAENPRARSARLRSIERLK